MYIFPTIYTTVENVLSAMPAIGSVTNITSAVIAQYIGASDALINAKISRQYSVPVVGDVPLLQSLSLDITLYNMLAKRIYVGEQLSKSPWPDRYKEALGILDEIAEGTLQLIGSSGSILEPSLESTGQVWSSTEDTLPTMTEDDMTLSFVDTYKIDVIRGERE
jgi:phage gp36-like protein